MSGFEVVPANEVQTMLAAVKRGDCCACYQPITPKDDGLYCHDCDPRDQEGN